MILLYCCCDTWIRAAAKIVTKKIGVHTKDTDIISYVSYRTYHDIHTYVRHAVVCDTWHHIILYVGEHVYVQNQQHNIYIHRISIRTYITYPRPQLPFAVYTYVVQAVATAVHIYSCRRGCRCRVHQPCAPGMFCDRSRPKSNLKQNK